MKYVIRNRFTGQFLSDDVAGEEWTSDLQQAAAFVTRVAARNQRGLPGKEGVEWDICQVELKLVGVPYHRV